MLRERPGTLTFEAQTTFFCPVWLPEQLCDKSSWATFGQLRRSLRSLGATFWNVCAERISGNSSLSAMIGRDRAPSITTGASCRPPGRAQPSPTRQRWRTVRVTKCSRKSALTPARPSGCADVESRASRAVPRCAQSRASRCRRCRRDAPAGRRSWITGRPASTTSPTAPPRRRRATGRLRKHGAARGGGGSSRLSQIDHKGREHCPGARRGGEVRPDSASQSADFGRSSVQPALRDMDESNFAVSSWDPLEG